ncbi:DNA helicase mcm9 [Homalodisca vitripennis]|nr:DNA helicase mcm9 [Homalodisca vitripennis]
MVLLDSCNTDWDRIVSGFILEGKDPAKDCKSSSLWSLEKLQAYFSVIKNLQPRFSDNANKILTRYYQEQRKMAARSLARTTVRLLESLVRLSQAHAKLMYREEVTVLDAIVTVALIESSMQSTALIGQVNILHTSFPKDPVDEYARQAELILRRLNLSDVLEEEMANIEKMRKILKHKRNQPLKKQTFENENRKNTSVENVLLSQSQNEVKETSLSLSDDNEKMALFESANVNDQESIEELVFPSTSKVSEKLCEVLASIRRARERNAYEATQHLQAKKDKKSGKMARGTREKRKGSDTISKKCQKEALDISEDSDKFDTSFLDISITPEKDSEPVGSKRSKELKDKTRKGLNRNIRHPITKSNIDVISPESNGYDVEVEIEDLFEKKNECKLGKLKTKNKFHHANKNKESVDKIDSDSEVSIDEREISKESKSFLNEKGSVDTQKKSNSSFSNKSKTETTKKSLKCEEGILDSTFKEICAVGASKKGIGEKLDVFLKRKFDFKTVQPVKKFKHYTEEEEFETCKETSKNFTVNSTDITEFLPEITSSAKKSRSIKNNSSLNNILSLENEENKLNRTVSSTKPTVNAKTHQKLMKFSAKTKSNISDSDKLPDSLLNIKDEQETLENSNEDEEFNISSYCDLEVSRQCVEDADSDTGINSHAVASAVLSSEVNSQPVMITKEGSQSKLGSESSSNQTETTKPMSTIRDDSEPTTATLSNYSQPFSLIDGEENLDDIDFDL